MDKAYIVANKQQEHDVLEKLEREGKLWWGRDKPTEWTQSEGHVGTFPYVLFVGNVITWNMITKLEDEEIVYDGRKEEQMSEKYVVSQEVMNELVEWKTEYHLDQNAFVTLTNLDKLPIEIDDWRYIGTVKERNNRLIAIIRWVNGENVFEVEKPKKWVVRSKNTYPDGTHRYVQIIDGFSDWQFSIMKATKFDTKEEAGSWANSHQDVVEVEE